MRSGAQLRRNTSHPTVKVQTPRAVRLSKPVDIDPHHVRGALTSARGQDMDSFRRSEADWLRDNIAPLGTAIEVTFGHVMAKEGPIFAEAVMMGSYLGSSVLRLAANGEPSLETAANNVRTWEVVERGMLYDGHEATEAVICDVFGQEASTELMEIRSAISRTACAVALSVSLNPAR